MENGPSKEIALSSLIFRIHADSTPKSQLQKGRKERKKGRKKRKKYTGWKMENTNRILLCVCEAN